MSFQSERFKNTLENFLKYKNGKEAVPSEDYFEEIKDKPDYFVLGFIAAKVATLQVSQSPKAPHFGNIGKAKDTNACKNNETKKITIIRCSSTLGMKTKEEKN